MPAAALYTSPLFRKSLLAASDAARTVYILSAKHGIVNCNDVIGPYDVTLKTMRRAERMAWGERAGPQIASLLNSKSTALMFCGEEYLAPIRSYIFERGATIDEPLKRRSLGQRLQDLAIVNGEQQLREDVARFYRIMRSVWMSQERGRQIGTTTGSLDWPSRGVYFIFEEHDGLSHGRLSRIVRVGTHAVSAGSKTTLWDRLSTHRGTGSGGGSHRSSIFRSHVGRAIMSQQCEKDWPASWGVGQTAPSDVRQQEARLEEEVSRVIARMRVVWLDIPDDAGPSSDRAYIERNSIGLLSRANLLTPLQNLDWLGRFSHDWRICTSGLWNLNHVFLRPDTEFLARLSHYAERTIGNGFTLPKQTKPKRDRAQMTLFGGRN
jgi:tRNA pseudouridine-54 N-methylase